MIYRCDTIRKTYIIKDKVANLFEHDTDFRREVRPCFIQGRIVKP